MASALGKLLAVLVVAVWAATANATLITYTGSAVVDDSDFEDDIDENDIFYFTFTYDDSVADSDSSSGASWTDARFNDALISFSLTAHADNDGDWDPTSGTFDVPERITLTDYGSYFRFRFFLEEDDEFDEIDGEAFDDINFILETQNTSLATPDTGTGQTLAQLLGGSLPDDVSIYKDEYGFKIENDEGDDAELKFTAFSYQSSSGTVPAPATLALFGLGLAGLGWSKRKKA